MNEEMNQHIVSFIGSSLAACSSMLPLMFDDNFAISSCTKCVLIEGIIFRESSRALSVLVLELSLRMFMRELEGTLGGNCV